MDFSQLGIIYGERRKSAAANLSHGINNMKKLAQLFTQLESYSYNYNCSAARGFGHSAIAADYSYAMWTTPAVVAAFEGAFKMYEKCDQASVKLIVSTLSGSLFLLQLHLLRLLLSVGEQVHGMHTK